MGQPGHIPRLLPFDILSSKCVSSGGNGDSDEGFVLDQLSVEFLEVLEFPLNLPFKFPMCQFNGVKIDTWHPCCRGEALHFQNLRFDGTAREVRLNVGLFKSLSVINRREGDVPSLCLGIAGS